MNINQYFPDKEHMVLKRGTVIYDPDELLVTPYVYFMLKGSVCMRGISREGVARIYILFSGERFINHFPLINKNLQSDYSNPKTRMLPLIALTDCVVYRIDAEAFLKLYLSDKRFNELITQQIQSDFNACLQNFISTEQDPVCTRLCRALLDFSIEKNGTRFVDQSFTNNILAEYIGAHPVTISKIIAKLVQCGYIQKQGRKIVLIQPGQIQRLVDTQEEITY